MTVKTFLVPGIRFFDPTTMETDVRVTIYHAAIRAYNAQLEASGRSVRITTPALIDRFLEPVLERRQLFALNGRPC